MGTKRKLLQEVKLLLVEAKQVIGKYYNVGNDKLFTTARGLPVILVQPIADGYEADIFMTAKEVTADYLKNPSKYAFFEPIMKQYLWSTNPQEKDIERVFTRYLPRFANRIDADLLDAISTPNKVSKNQLYDLLVGTYKLHPALFDRAFGPIENKEEGRLQKSTYGSWNLMYDTTAKTSIEEVKELLDNATKYLAAKGMEKLAYGDIFIVNTLPGRTVADYSTTSDSVRVAFKQFRIGKHDVMSSFIHELGHRDWYKFMSAETHREIYKQYLHKTMGAISTHVTPGDIVTSKATGDKFEVLDSAGKPYYVAKVIAAKSFKPKEDATYKLSFDQIGTVFIPDNKEVDMDRASYFPSTYALSNEKEFYSELFAGWVLGTLPEPANSWVGSLSK